MKRRKRFASKRGDLIILLPWLMEYTRRTSTRQSGQPAKRRTLICSRGHHQHDAIEGGVTVAACSFLAELRTPGNEETWEHVKAKFPEEDQTCVSEAAAAAVAASFSGPEEGIGPNWRPEEEFDPHVALEVINSRNALSGAGSDSLCFSLLQSKIITGFGREKFAAGIEAFWRRIIDDPNAFPPEF